MNDEYYTIELHTALLKKDGTAFWKCWRSKFEFSNRLTQVDGLVDADVISEKFAEYFSNCFSGNNDDQIGRLKEEYFKLRKNYFGLPQVIADLKRDKAADIHGLTAEHLMFSHLITIIMRPSSLGGGCILRRTLSVCLSVCPFVRLSVCPSVPFADVLCLQLHRLTSEHPK